MRAYFETQKNAKGKSRLETRICNYAGHDPHGTLNQPPMQYVAQWRLQLAAQLMRNGDLLLAVIAERVGYDSEAAFNRAFKREFGLPPASWRRSEAGGFATTN